MVGLQMVAIKERPPPHQLNSASNHSNDQFRTSDCSNISLSLKTTRTNFELACPFTNRLRAAASLNTMASQLGIQQQQRLAGAQQRQQQGRAAARSMVRPLLSAPRPFTAATSTTIRSRRQICFAGGKLDEVSLFADSSLLSPSSASTSAAAQAAAGGVDGVELKSKVCFV